MTAADICRERGWGKGTLIVVKFRTLESVYVVSAIGEASILAIQVGTRIEGQKWTVLRHRDETQIISADGMHAIPHLPWETPDLSNTNEKENA